MPSEVSSHIYATDRSPEDEPRVEDPRTRPVRGSKQVCVLCIFPWVYLQLLFSAKASHYRRRERLEAENSRLRDKKTRLVMRIGVQESRLAAHSSSLHVLIDKISGQDAQLLQLRIECERQVTEVERLLANIHVLEQEVKCLR